MTTGHDLLNSLVEEYDPTTDSSAKVYVVKKNDRIQGCHGLELLDYLKRNRPNLPEVFRLWAYGRKLCAMTDSCRNKSNGHIYIPFCYLHDEPSQPIRWQPVYGTHLPASNLAILASAYHKLATSAFVQEKTG